ncbi:MAG: NAD-dependent epimerase/dehydratase family protein [Candidatus Eisenbacteria bacterium]
MATDNVLVTGASGHLGVHLIEALDARGIHPRVLLRQELPEEAWGNLRVRPVIADLADATAEQLAPMLSGIDTVFHLAALVSLRPSDADRIDRTNRRGTIAMVEACRMAGVRRFVHVSVAASVGAGTEERDESSPWNLDTLRIPYLQSKRAAEAYLLDHARQHSGSPEIVIANPSLLIGPPRAIGRWNHGVPRGLNARALARLIHFYIDGRLNLVDVRDVAHGLIRLSEIGRDGERYLLTGSSYTIREILDEMARFVPLGRVRVRLPRRAIVWGATLAALLADPASDAPATSVADCFRLLEFPWRYRNTKAQEELGFEPTPLESSLSDLFGWARAQGVEI